MNAWNSLIYLSCGMWPRCFLYGYRGQLLYLFKIRYENNYIWKVKHYMYMVVSYHNTGFPMKSHSWIKLNVTTDHSLSKNLPLILSSFVCTETRDKRLRSHVCLLRFLKICHNNLMPTGIPMFLPSYQAPLIAIWGKVVFQLISIKRYLMKWWAPQKMINISVLTYFCCWINILTRVWVAILEKKYVLREKHHACLIRLLKTLFIY